MPDIDVTGTDATTSIDGMIVEHPGGGVISGTGNYNDFLAVGSNDITSQGYNTNDAASTAANNPAGLDMNDPKTQSLLVKDLPIKTIDGVDYYEIRLDINEPNNQNDDGTGAPIPQVALSEFQLFTSTRQAVLADYKTGSYQTRAFGDDFTLRYDIDALADNTIILLDAGKGSGRDDYAFYIPVSKLAGAAPTDYVTLFTQFGPRPEQNAGFEEFRVQSASEIYGTKFADVDADGIKDASEAGVAGITVYLDANDNGILDAGERSTVTDAGGNYIFYGLVNGSYVVREALTADQSEWYRLTTGDANGRHLVTIAADSSYLVDIGNLPLIYDFNISKVVSGITGGYQDELGNWHADSASDVVNYTITLTNAGNTELTMFSFADLNGDYDLSTISGDTDSDGNLDLGEVWTISATHTVTQDELDGRGTDAAGAIDGDADTDNRAAASFKHTEVKSADAVSLLDYKPDFSVAKDVTSVSGSGSYDAVSGLWTATTAGDVINYDIVIRNTGNITLTGFSIADDNALLGAVTGDADGDGDLDVGETWTVKATHVVTQYELNAKGTAGDGSDDGDGDTDNLVTVDFTETDFKSDDAVSLLLYNPLVDITKFVSVTGKEGSYDDANTAAAGKENVAVNSPVYFKVTVANTGNIDLTSVLITDINTTGGGTVTTTLFSNRALNAGLTDASLEGDVNGDGILNVDETWTIKYSQPFDIGQHVNTAYVTSAEGAQDEDAAYYYGIMPGPGVRTPGFWGSPNGLEFWDGKAGASKAGQTGFAKGELTYAVDHDNAGATAKVAGLLIGDMNKDGVTNNGENTFYIGLSDALALINASSKLENSDAAVKIGRDAVATWLNYLAGNGLGSPADPQSAATYLNEGIDWLQTWAGKANYGAGGEIFDAYDARHPGVKTTTSAWTSATADVAFSGSAIHNALDYYNNNGQTSAGGIHYAQDGDDGAFLKLLSDSQTSLHLI